VSSTNTLISNGIRKTLILSENIIYCNNGGTLAEAQVSGNNKGVIHLAEIKIDLTRFYDLIGGYSSQANQV
jgi:hypothetical protein